MIVTASGEPVGFVMAPGRPADITISEQTDIALPSDSELCGYRGSDDYDYEDMPEESDGITLKPIRKKNSKRATDSYIERLAYRKFRKKVGTTFSQITALFPKKIHSVTQKVFLPEIVSFIIASGIHCLSIS